MTTNNTNNTNISSEAAVVAKLVEEHVAPRLMDVAPAGVKGLGIGGSDDVHVLILPDGLAAHSVKGFIDEYRTAPERRKGTARLVELGSLIDHANRFRDADSALFAEPSPTAPRLTVVFDYHRRNLFADTASDRGGTDFVEGAPRFGCHRAEYLFPLSDEWRAWNEKNGALVSQSEFAAFLEDRIIDIADPNAAFASAKKFAEALGIRSFAAPTRLLELSRGLTIHVDERATSKIDPSTGETLVHYSAEHNDETGAPLQVPRAFLLQIPVFRAGVAYQFAVRLKYRTGGGKIAWAYEIHDARKAFDDAFHEACETAAEKTGLPLFYGAPES